MATVLQRTGSGAYYGKMTISFWVKRSKLGEQGIFGRREGSATANLSTCHFGGDDSLLINFRDGGGTSKYYMITDRLFRDVGAWYHIVFAIDGTHATASERSKLYVNGVRETSFQLLNNPSSTGYEVNMFVGGSYNTYIGRGLKSQTDTWLTFEGCMSHFHCSTGYTYDADVFGSTDSVTGEWKINTNPTFTLGTDGFTVLKDGNTITDQSANSNNFTVYSGTLTKTEDNPSNVFATMNPLGNYDGTLSNGNTRVKTNQTNYRYIASTLGVSSGRYYWECKLQEIGNYMLCGITDQPSFPASGVTMLGNSTYDCAVYTGDQSANGGNGHLYHSSTSNASNTNTPGAFMSAFSQGDILTFALDLDSATKKLYIGVGGNWANGSGSTNQTFANATGVSIVVPQNTNTGFYFPACGDYSGTYGHWEYNFGNGYFGTTQVSSAGTNASGLGIFEYDVPTGYTALCTKGLNE